MRECILVCYDIADEKRLRRVFKTMKGYGEHWQYSIFFCVLRPIDVVLLQGDLEKILNLEQDQVLMIRLGTNEEAAREAAKTIGKPLGFSMERMIVV
jgi:CRISPR-associated protein Cas2